MHIAKKIAYVLVIVGALNWGLIGVTAGGLNLVEILFGSYPVIENIIYVLVGISAVMLIFAKSSGCSCSKGVCECDVEINKTDDTPKMSDSETKTV